MGIGKQLALLIHDPDHQNAKQVLSVLIWHKTKQEDDALSKQAKLLRELYGPWKTKQEIGK